VESMRIRRRLQLAAVLVLLSVACACNSSGNYDFGTVCSSDAMTATVNMIEDPPVRCDCSFRVVYQYYYTYSYTYPNGYQNAPRFNLISSYSPASSSGQGTAYLEAQNPNPKGCVLGDGTSNADWITNIYSTSQPDGRTSVSYSLSGNYSPASRNGVISFGNGTQIYVNQPASGK
jgi:hypothetical protein